jgi:hypothetical protein
MVMLPVGTNTTTWMTMPGSQAAAPSAYDSLLASLRFHCLQQPTRTSGCHFSSSRT